MRLEVRDLGVKFGDVVALPPVNLTILGGQMVAIMGPSGSGKSTLLGVIDGQIPPTEGRVRLSHESTCSPQPEWIFQSSPMLNRRTALDNAALGAVARGYDIDEAFDAAEKALTHLGLAERLHAVLFTLSGGERQRVAIARSIVSRAQIILADEPTASLDTAARELVVGALRAAATGGAAVVVATHDSFVSERCDRILNLDPERTRST